MILTKSLNIGIGLALVAGLGYAFGRYAQPPKIETVEVTKEVIKKDIVTVVKEIVRPDGTKETETRTEDRSTEQTNSSNTTKTAQRAAYKVNVMAAYMPDKAKMEYGIMVQKNFIGPISLGAYVTTEKTVGITAGLEF